MRIPLRTKVTLTLVAFGLIPAGIIAAFAYTSALDFMGRQRLMIRQAAKAISDHTKLLVQKNNELAQKGDKAGAENPPPLKWELTEEDLQDLQRHISDTVRDYNLHECIGLPRRPEELPDHPARQAKQLQQQSPGLQSFRINTRKWPTSPMASSVPRRSRPSRTRPNRPRSSASRPFSADPEACHRVARVRHLGRRSPELGV